MKERFRVSKSANFKMEPATNLGGGLSIAVTKERVILVSKPLPGDTAIEMPSNLDLATELRDKLDKIIFDALPDEILDQVIKLRNKLDKISSDAQSDEIPLNLDQVVKLRDKLDKIIFDAQPEKMQQVDSREEINRVLDDYAKGNVLHFAMIGVREDGSGLVISESPATLVKQMLEDGADAIEKSLSGSSVKH